MLGGSIGGTLSFAVLVAVASQAVHLTIQPWTGHDLIASAKAAAKYRLVVTGPPKAAVHLETSGVARGWLAAFCTPQFCAPQQVDLRLPPSGRSVFQFELIRETSDGPNRSGAVVTASGGALVRVPPVVR